MATSLLKSRRDFLCSCAAFSLAASGTGLALGETPQQAQTTQQAVPPTIIFPRSVGRAAGPPDFNEIDALARSFIEHSGVGAGQLAIVRDGVLELSRSYSAPPPSGYAAVDRQSLFRVASLSKMFTCAAIGELHSRGKLVMDAKVFPLLGIKAPAKPRDRPDPRIDDITIQHLVDHAGGWNDHESLRTKDGAHVPGTDWDPHVQAA